MYTTLPWSIVVALDAATGKAVEDALIELNEKRGLSLLVVTHNERLAARLHRTVRIVDGRIDGD